MLKVSVLLTTALLIVFLPLSAWLVSASGDYLISLGRDILLFVLLFLSFFSLKLFRLRGSLAITVIVYITIVLASWFYREASLTQWLRGVRYLVEPFALFLVLRSFSYNDREFKFISSALILALCLVLTGILIELIWPGTLLFTVNEGEARGRFGYIHYASTLRRFQSTLAGPNALGLYLLVALLLFPTWKAIRHKSWITPLFVLSIISFLATYSRSSYAGLLVAGVYIGFYHREQLRLQRKLFASLAVLVVLFIALLAWLRPGELTRYQSNTERIQQYQRVWDQRSEIGFWGRGAGSSGLVSQYRFDSGQNYFTENTYLDTYESIGVLGALAYIGMWLNLWLELGRKKTLNAQAVRASVLGFLVAGLFINHFTGQAAIWTLMIFAALVLGESENASTELQNPVV